MRSLFTTCVLGFALFSVMSLATDALAQAVLADSLAHYEVRGGGRVERLSILRLSDHVEHRYLDRGVTEVWRRGARGELAHWKIFEREKRSVHYTAGDLRTIHAEPTWAQLTTLRGQAQESQLVWSEKAGWPTSITIGSKHDRTRFRLRSASACSRTSPCVPLDPSHFRELEFADLGDSENDPFVRTFLARFSRAHAH